ncbi:MAG TPA: xylose isomerase [Erwinia sp.]|uniref:sugar phosphate isomerase/epimerase family protein n=1 Tax=Erwinia citreus TaxID=558 RepID=UPI000E8EF820|nr:sugar phosphate isomerase/epimerase [Erwinia sp.]HBV38727.1 xylose isomerase [Erwinia sp.]
MKPEIIVVTAAFGRDRVAELGGQQAVVPIVAAAGADGIEIRRELFSEAEIRQLSTLGQAISEAGLAAFYSVPEALYTEKGALNPNLDNHLNEAKQLNARLIKYSLGHYQPGSSASPLRDGLPLTLVVENDQTDCGTLAALAPYFSDTAPVGMTFDMGNWLWVGDSPTQAAKQLASFVSYVHVKAATLSDGGWRAIALNEADNLWRETLALLPADVPRGIEFPLEGDDLVAVTRHYVDLLREV